MTRPDVFLRILETADQELIKALEPEDDVMFEGKLPRDPQRFIQKRFHLR